jgi:hypothetical protein
MKHFSQENDFLSIRVICEEQVDKNIPWDFFNGASQNNGQSCGGGVVLF